MDYVNYENGEAMALVNAQMAKKSIFDRVGQAVHAENADELQSAMGALEFAHEFGLVEKDEFFYLGTAIQWGLRNQFDFASKAYQRTIEVRK